MCITYLQQVYRVHHRVFLSALSVYASPRRPHPDSATYSNARERASKHVRGEREVRRQGLITNASISIARFVAVGALGASTHVLRWPQLSAHGWPYRAHAPANPASRLRRRNQDLTRLASAGFTRGLCRRSRRRRLAGVVMHKGTFVAKVRFWAKIGESATSQLSSSLSSQAPCGYDVHRAPAATTLLLLHGHLAYPLHLSPTTKQHCQPFRLVAPQPSALPGLNGRPRRCQIWKRVDDSEKALRSRRRHVHGGATGDLRPKTCALAHCGINNQGRALNSQLHSSTLISYIVQPTMIILHGVIYVVYRKQ